MDFHGAKVFITGGAGFIGSTIADQILEAGAAQVVVLDDLVRGRRENLATAMKTGKVSLHEGDIADAALVAKLTEGCDLVFHQAALRITHCAEVPVRAVQVMINGTQNVLEAAVKHKVKKVLAASSASVYGEPSYLPMDEGHPFNNRTLYGAAKIANEQILRSYNDMYGLDYAMLRPFNVYGPRMDVFGAYTEVMIRWLERLAKGQAPVIFGDGTQSMDFIHVADVARAYLLAAKAPVTDQVFNAGSGIETSLKDLCAGLCEAEGHPGMKPEFAAPRKVNPVSRRRAAIEKARDVLGFTTTIGLSEGLKDLVRWQAQVLAEAKKA
jgi:nucleoside-diphosphate-sugar epimerase